MTRRVNSERLPMLKVSVSGRQSGHCGTDWMATHVSWDSCCLKYRVPVDLSGIALAFGECMMEQRRNMDQSINLQLHIKQSHQSKSAQTTTKYFTQLILNHPIQSTF